MSAQLDDRTAHAQEHGWGDGLTGVWGHEGCEISMHSVQSADS